MTIPLGETQAIVSAKNASFSWRRRCHNSRGQIHGTV
jgi:hypothetical protein